MKTGAISGVGRAVWLVFPVLFSKAMLRTVLFVIVIGVTAGTVAVQQPAQGSQAAATGSPTPSQQPSDEEIMQHALKTAQATIQWDRATTAGMKADVQLLKKREAEGQIIYEYHLKVSGAPHDQPYTLMAWPVTAAEPVAMMDGLAVAQDGTVGCPATSPGSCAQRMKGAELRLTYRAAKGEIFRHALVSVDQKSRAFFSIIPDPIQAVDKACSLEVVRLSPNFELVVVHGRGFTPDEDLRFHEQSYQENHDLPVKADPQGEFQAPLTPSVKGRTSGTADVTVVGKACSPTVSFNWGQQP